MTFPLSRLSEPGDLSEPDTDALVECEANIERNFRNARKAFVEIGNDLRRIRDDRLYKVMFGTFEEYCRERWGITRNYAYKKIAAAEVVGNLCTTVHILPENERQIRPLASLSFAQQREAWSRAIETAPHGKPTAEQVTKVIAELFPPGEPEGNRGGLFDDEDEDPDGSPAADPEPDEDDEEDEGGSEYDEDRLGADDEEDEEEPETHPGPRPAVWSASELERKSRVEEGFTVLANQRCDKTLIEWAKGEGRYFPIDRGSYPYGNPMRLEGEHDRADVIAWYREHWLPFFRDEIDWDEIGNGKVLGCWCHPEPCHGDVLLEAIAIEGGEIP